MKPKIGYEALVERAEQNVTALSSAQVQSRLGAQGVLLVDLRDIREVKREGKIAGSVHVPRGMLEFWIDPASPYYQSYFDNAHEIILYCNKGWRSALAAETLQTMGFDNIAHLQGGLEQWIADSGDVEKEVKS
jgi:rhodanese-related sulfurtransferase